MTTATITGADLRLRNAVVRQLDWDPEVNASEIGVTAVDGVITLTGFIDTYAGKLAAERVAKRVRGVRAVANELMVRLILERTDTDIVRDAANALRLRPALGDTVQVVVHNGHLTLTGTVEWLYLKELAGSIVKYIRGVRGVNNRIKVQAKGAQRDVERRIMRALHYNADFDARHITVSVADSVVTLKGAVGSWAQREAAQEAAACAPGITHVDNQIMVAPLVTDEVEPTDDTC